MKGRAEIDVTTACAHVTSTRARHWPANAECPTNKGEVCSRYLSDDGRTCKTYVCAGCKLRVPACFGAADAYLELCDSCAEKRRLNERS